MLDRSWVEVGIDQKRSQTDQTESKRSDGRPPLEPHLAVRLKLKISGANWIQEESSVGNEQVRRLNGKTAQVLGKQICRSIWYSAIEKNEVEIGVQP